MNYVLIVLAVLAVLLLLGCVSLLFGFVVMIAWNAVIPDVFSGPTLSLLQGWALWVLFSILVIAIRGK